MPLIIENYSGLYIEFNWLVPETGKESERSFLTISLITKVSEHLSRCWRVANQLEGWQQGRRSFLHEILPLWLFNAEK